MALTSEQQRIVQYAQSGLSFKVFAYAGSGKTSTMIYACKEASSRPSKFNRYSRGLFLAFNSAISKDAGAKLKSRNINAIAKTWHSLAREKIKKDYAKKIYNLRGADKILTQYLYNSFYITDQRIAVKSEIFQSNKDNAQKPKLQFRNVSKRTCKGYIIKAINNFFASTDKEITLNHFKPICPNWADLDFFINIFVKNTLFSETSRLIENIFNTEEEKYPLSFSAALKIYQLSKPLLHNEYDFLIVDEAQDTDLVALDILNNQDLNKIQIIVVGDSYQQIYSWRGALDALDNVKINDVLHLSKSFRFGPNIAKFASSILKNYFINFKTLVTGNENIQSKVYEIQNCNYTNYNAIITRTNAGAFDAFIKAIEQNPDLKISVDINIKKLTSYINDYEKLEKGQKLSTESDLILFENLEQLEEYVDENPTDSDISAPYRLIIKIGLNDLKEKIIKVSTAVKKENDNETYDLIISTAHKSKGLQFHNVILFEDFNPFLFQQIETDNGKITNYSPVSDEEVRLFYVAVTRAIDTITLENFSLLFVESLVKDSLNDKDFLIDNNQEILSIQRDIDLCHKLLIKNQKHFFNQDLTDILSQYDIYNIIENFLKKPNL